MRTISPNKNDYRFQGVIAALFGAMIAAGAIGCGTGPGRETGKRPQTPATPEATLSPFEQDLESMRTADFDYIFVVRRTDGGKFSADDKKFLKQNTPAETNRFVLSDDDTAVIIGTSFVIENSFLDALKKRFSIEDVSPKRGGTVPETAQSP